MKGQTIKIVVSLVVLIGLALAVSLHREHEDQKDQAKEKSKKLMPYSGDDIEKILIENKHGKVVLERRKPGDLPEDQKALFDVIDAESQDAIEWELREPVQTLANQQEVESFLEQVEGLSYLKVVREQANNLPEYKLDPAQLSITLYPKDTKLTPVVIRMGDDNPSQEFYYFTSSAQNNVVLGEKILQPILTREPLEWRTYFLARLTNFDQVRTIKSSNGMELVKDNGAWNMKAPYDLPADQANVQTLLRNLNSLLVEKVIDLDDEHQVSDFGVDRPTKTLEFISTTSDGQEQKMVLALGEGKTKQTKDGLYLRRDQWPLVHQILQAQRNDLFKDPQFYVDKKMGQFNADDVSSLSFAMGDQTGKIEKQQNRWWITSPYKDLANPRRVRSILENLSSLEAASVVGLDQIKNTPSILSFEINGSKGQDASLVEFFEKNGHDYVRKNTPKTIVYQLADGDPREGFLDDLTSLRNDDLLPSEKDGIQSIEFSVGKALIRVKKEKDAWKLIELKSDSPSINLLWKQEVTLHDFVNKVLDVTIADFYPEAKINEKAFDQGTLTIKDQQGQSLTWKVGKVEGELQKLLGQERNLIVGVALTKIRELHEFLMEPENTRKE
ncbi:MAG: DUF4340 domain-containing protein [Bdellovibrionota bacterium]